MKKENLSVSIQLPIDEVKEQSRDVELVGKALDHHIEFIRKLEYNS